MARETSLEVASGLSMTRRNFWIKNCQQTTSFYTYFFILSVKYNINYYTDRSTDKTGKVIKNGETY